MLSKVKECGKITFPEFMGDKLYMIPFYKNQPLSGEAARWQNVVNQMLDGVETDARMYLMVDEGVVNPGQTHRRGGLHIDGNWLEGLQAHGNFPPRHSFGRNGCTMSMKEEALLLASNVTACRALNGEWQGVPREGGDCSHIDVSGMEEVILRDHRSYIGNVSMLHESLPLRQKCKRALVRINIPGYIVH